ncbi:uncharacterized protein LOC115622548 [Scaptodrosophila lebanonensis]|uniref:Uncharacterized protein LOC115622548 n=1 Tax=Drosophila lebanonensis TaxID=7225 RepID=A0A6J2TAJ9_DROLE|nr:uncharacterized protein LOC115622548 [Scaptodrosophila lebanonensis]
MSYESSSNNAAEASGTVSYALYLHRLELQRPNRRLMCVANTKLQLTNELISQTHRQWMAGRMLCSYQERSALNRELQYRDILRRNMVSHLERQQQSRRERFQMKAHQEDEWHWPDPSSHI